MRNIYVLGRSSALNGILIDTYTYLSIFPSTSSTRMTTLCAGLSDTNAVIPSSHRHNLLLGNQIGPMLRGDPYICIINFSLGLIALFSTPISLSSVCYMCYR
ncbi:hypothetical protein BGX38DRAFT_58782 [Terfezia claveryi]|nr:hypothetical protein BGX38DRAFT_58782 [Terfezia claveryi]